MKAQPRVELAQPAAHRKRSLSLLRATMQVSRVGLGIKAETRVPRDLRGGPGKKGDGLAFLASFPPELRVLKLRETRARIGNPNVCC